MVKETTVQGRGEGAIAEKVSSAPTFSPQVDIIERADSMVVLADMPGVSKERVEAMLERGVLTVNGEVDAPEEPGMRLERREYDIGNFHRCFAVGEGLDPSGVAATLDNGVLRLVIPKAPEYKARRIEIKGA